MASDPRILIAGAGFGGLWAARELSRLGLSAEILDRTNFHTFFPLLYQVAAAELSPGDIAYPVRSIVRRLRGIRFRTAEVEGLDLDGRRLLTDGGALDYDYLILALGSEPNFFGVPGAAEHALPLRWMDQAIVLRHHLLQRFERAANEPDPARRRRMLTFVIVGGGATGVEFSGALAELIYGPMLPDYPTIGRSDVSVVLLEAGDRLLAGMSERLSAYAADRLRGKGVDVRLGATVESVARDSVRLAGGDALRSETVVWTAGIQGEPRASDWGLPVGRGGRILAELTLSVPGHPEVFVIGDLAYLESGGQPLPQVAPVAIQQGRVAARNVYRMNRGTEAEAFDFRDPGMLAVVGRNAAVADVFGRAFQGFTAWVLWLTIHVAKLIGFRNRILVLVNWAWNYVFYRRAVRLILPDARRPGSAIGRTRDSRVG